MLPTGRRSVWFNDVSILFYSGSQVCFGLTALVSGCQCFLKPLNFLWSRSASAAISSSVSYKGLRAAGGLCVDEGAARTRSVSVLAPYIAALPSLSRLILPPVDHHSGVSTIPMP